MATEMELRAQLTKLKAARRSGLKRVRFGEREMEYRSDADMAKAIRDIEDEIDELLNCGRKRSRRYLTTTCKGL